MLTIMRTELCGIIKSVVIIRFFLSEFLQLPKTGDESENISAGDKPMKTSENETTSYMNEYVKPFFLDGKDTEECIFMIHGFTGSAANMRPLAEALNKGGEGYPVCAVLLPGHGTSMQDMMRRNWKEWVIAATAEYKKLQAVYPKISIIGLSMGGDIALCIASRLKVNRIVTISTPILLRSQLSRFAGILRFFRKYITWWNYKPLDGELVPEYEMGYKGMPVRSIAQLRRLTVAARRRLHRVKQPILVVQSLRDKLVHPKSPYIIFDNVKSEYKELILLEHARHNAILSPERFRLFEDAEEFLKKDIQPKEQVLKEAENS